MARSLKESVKAIGFTLLFISLIIGKINHLRNVRARVFWFVFIKRVLLNWKKQYRTLKKQEGGAPKGYFLYKVLGMDEA
ncbi:hypothetical protein [Spiroplasma endosymbiont of Polydrusus cervinus]|uniref:hypothetical protein n=1 Tax=Spiroplasma endosymbiont of Polydrusus cervinus TaxID=3066287 RepID=UPI0030CF2D51